MAAAPRGVTPRRATTAPPGRGTTVLQGSARRTAPPASRATNDRPRAVSRGVGGSGSLDTSLYPQAVPGLDRPAAVYLALDAEAQADECIPAPKDVNHRPPKAFSPAKQRCLGTAGRGHHRLVGALASRRRDR